MLDTLRFPRHLGRMFQMPVIIIRIIGPAFI